MKITPNPRIILAGSVNSSLKTLKKLIQHNMNVVAALGLNPDAAKNVSGFQDLQPVAEEAHIDFRYFSKLNDEAIVSYIRQKEPDLLFVIGLSQIVKKELLNIPTYGCIGYHPTLLPQGRGRGAIAWIVLGEASPAATFFYMDEGMDSGDILAQQPVEMEGNEYAGDTIDKIMEAIDAALDDLLPSMKKGEIFPRRQDPDQATYLGKRNPEDGYIDWSLPAEQIHKLIRAVSHPLPGAFTFYGQHKLTIWRAEIIRNSKYKGVPGRILNINEEGILVQTAKNNILITDYECKTDIKPKVGKKLGIDLPVLYEKLIQQLRES